MLLTVTVTLKRLFQHLNWTITIVGLVVVASDVPRVIGSIIIFDARQRQ